MDKIFEEVRKERARQDKIWGGPKHDDLHDINDWEKYLFNYIKKAKYSYRECFFKSGRPEEHRRRMIQIIALATAALQSFDRKLGEKDEIKH